METLRQLQQHLPPFALDVFRLSIWLVLLMVIFIPFERFYALHPQKIIRKAFLTDLAYYFLNSLLPKLLLIVPLTMIVGALHHVAPSALHSWAADSYALLNASAVEMRDTLSI